MVEIGLIWKNSRPLVRHEKYDTDLWMIMIRFTANTVPKYSQ